MKCYDVEVIIKRFYRNYTWFVELQCDNTSCNERYIRYLCQVDETSAHFHKRECKRVSLDEIKRRLKAVHGDVVSIIDATYTAQDKKATFIDVEYGTWTAQVKGVCNGRRHSAYKDVNWHLVHRVTLAEVQERLLVVHKGNVTIKPETWSATHIHATFIDQEFGEWASMPYSVLAGSSHPVSAMRNRARNSKRTVGRVHWKTGETLCCTGSYEVAFVDWCNVRRIDFDWQVPFIMPNGKHRYYVDAYIKDGEFVDTWIEIKGTWMRKGAEVSKAKWEWFHSAYPNSQIWFRERLLELGILVPQPKGQ